MGLPFRKLCLFGPGYALKLALQPEPVEVRCRPGYLSE
jgi:hypothetical protein